MLRAAVLVDADKKAEKLILVVHHIAADGWSMPILLNELKEVYKANVTGKTVRLNPLPVQYADFSIWERENQEALENKLNYWETKLGDVTKLEIPVDYARPKLQSTSGANFEFTLNKDLVAKLEGLATTHGATLFMTLLSAYKVLLQRYNINEGSDVVVGIPMANRVMKEVEPLIGFFVNTQPIRTSVEGTFTELLNEVKQATLEAYDHQNAPFEKIVDRVVQDRDLSHTPIFQTLFALHTRTKDHPIQLGGAKLTIQPFDYDIAKFDITFDVEQNKNGLKCKINYCTDLFKEATIEQFANHYSNILNAVVDNASAEVEQISLASENEQLLIASFNDSDQVELEFETLAESFKNTVAQYPESIALVFGEEKLTYQELDVRPNRLANSLLASGVQAQDRVGLLFHRGIEMIVGILATIKSGASYVPLDPAHPTERLQYVMNDASVRVVIFEDDELAENLLREGIASLINRPKSFEQVDGLTFLREGDGNIAPIFIVPGAFGIADFYYDLANALGDLLGEISNGASKIKGSMTLPPLYGIQLAGLRAGERPMRSIPEIAEYCIQQIRKVESKEPIQVVGHSIGGLVAMEICKQLELKGQQVKAVVLDSDVSTTASKGDDLLDNIEELVEHFVAHGFFAKLDTNFNDFEVDIFDELEEAKTYDYWSVIESLLEGYFTSFSIEDFRPIFDLFMTNDSINYEASEVNAENVLLVRAQKQDRGWNEQRKADKAWKAVLPNLQIVKSPGDHESMVLGDNARQLAKVVSQFFKQQ